MTTVPATISIVLGFSAFVFLCGWMAEKSSVKELKSSLAELNKELSDVKDSLSREISKRPSLFAREKVLAEEKRQFEAEKKHRLSSLDKAEQALDEREWYLEERLSEEQQCLDEERERLDEEKRSFDREIKMIISDKSEQYPYIATQIADLYYLYDKKLAEELASKARPALRASEDVLRIAKEKRALMMRVKALEYRIATYEAFSPTLASAADFTTSELCEAAESSDDCDRLRDWLSDSEYYLLPDVQKFQLALDRWRHRPRSNWQVGRDFERYIGFLYETNGWRVSYYGALKGKSDLCRDLIAEKGDQTLIIQCKRWAKEKTIHEKHVFQLFGSVMSYKIENPGTNPQGILITTCALSDVAVKYAEALHISCQQNYVANDLDTYPVIKCNISKDHEKIFHLPFDQQYDRILISSASGEKYVSTVQEAVDAGFRRAYRWRGGD